eukprot:TRINITY_DN8303_c0_g1_i1.p1 TRINITY_DN8303_c0_g1~~TRINITY_DN8303_c0_g1_i1.p1  ORF type:complete len:730 (+),score=135.49 TRINITY_DN8303_c0_g1_i1:59-2248(+)
MQQAAGQQRPAPPSLGADFPKHLTVVRQLGRGAYGTVYLCNDSSAEAQNGQKGPLQVAVKHVKNPAKHGKSILREVRLLARLRHENLLHLVDFAAVPGHSFDDAYLVLPYMPSDLHRVIQSKQALTDKHVQVIAVQVLRGVAYLHASGVCHRDLKPANILLTADCKVKVCDFGLARGDMALSGENGAEDAEAAGVLTEYVVTRWYRAPEVMLLPKQYTSSVDLWSVGCIVCEILGRGAIFPGKNHIDMISRVAEVLGTPSEEQISWLPRDSDAYRFIRKVCPKSNGKQFSSLYKDATSSCLDLVRGLLCWDPRQRLTAEEAQRHRYLANYSPQELAQLEKFDWSFDCFKVTTTAVQERLYTECARFHPEIVERDRRMGQGPPGSSPVGLGGSPLAQLKPFGAVPCSSFSSTAAPTPLGPPGGYSLSAAPPSKPVNQGAPLPSSKLQHQSSFVTPSSYVPTMQPRNDSTPQRRQAPPASQPPGRAVRHSVNSVNGNDAAKEPSAAGGLAAGSNLRRQASSSIGPRRTPSMQQLSHAPGPGAMMQGAGPAAACVPSSARGNGGSMQAPVATQSAPAGPMPQSARSHQPPPLSLRRLQSGDLGSARAAPSSGAAPPSAAPQRHAGGSHAATPPSMPANMPSNNEALHGRASGGGATPSHPPGKALAAPSTYSPQAGFRHRGVTPPPPAGRESCTPPPGYVTMAHLQHASVRAPLANPVPFAPMLRGLPMRAM